MGAYQHAKEGDQCTIEGYNALIDELNEYREVLDAITKINEIAYVPHPSVVNTAGYKLSQCVAWAKECVKKYSKEKKECTNKPST